MQTGKNLFFAGLGVVAFTEEKARETFNRMVDTGKTYDKDGNNLLSRATHEAKEMGNRFENRVQETVTSTLNRAACRAARRSCI